MSSLATATKTREASKPHAQADVPRFPVDMWGASTLSVITRPDRFPALTIDPAERDRQASLAFLHRLVMRAEAEHDVARPAQLAAAEEKTESRAKRPARDVPWLAPEWWVSHHYERRETLIIDIIDQGADRAPTMATPLMGAEGD